MEKRGCYEQDIIVFKEKDGRSEDVRMDESALFSLFPFIPNRSASAWSGLAQSPQPRLEEQIRRIKRSGIVPP